MQDRSVRLSFIIVMRGLRFEGVMFGCLGLNAEVGRLFTREKIVCGCHGELSSEAMLIRWRGGVPTTREVVEVHVVSGPFYNSGIGAEGVGSSPLVEGLRREVRDAPGDQEALSGHLRLSVDLVR